MSCTGVSLERSRAEAFIPGVAVVHNVEVMLRAEACMREACSSSARLARTRGATHSSGAVQVHSVPILEQACKKSPPAGVSSNDACRLQG